MKSATLSTGATVDPSQLAYELLAAYAVLKQTKSLTFRIGTALEALWVQAKLILAQLRKRARSHAA